MAITPTTLRPNALVAAAPGWSIGGGAASHNAAQSDNNDATYSLGTDSAFNSTGFLTLDLGTLSLPANSQVRSVTPRARVLLASGTNVTLYVALLYRPAGIWDEQVLTGSSFTLSTAYALATTVTLPAVSQSLDGTYLTQAEVDSLRIRFEGIEEVGTPSTFRIIESYVDVLYNEAPTVSSVAVTPTSPIATTTRPTFSYTFSDPESNSQERRWVKVFTDTQYGIGGFDPEISPYTWSTGEEISSLLTRVSDIDLAPTTTYRAYIKAADSGSNGRYSAWAFVQFTMAVPVPATPSIITIAELQQARVKVIIQGSDNMLTDNQASLETDTTGWVSNANCTIARSTAQARSGAASLSLTSSAGGTMSARITDAAAPVAVPGKRYQARASFRSAVSARQVDVDLVFKDAANATLATVSSAKLNDSTAGWVEIVTAGTAPLTTTKVVVITRVNSTGAASEVHYVDQISVAPVGSDNLLGQEQSSQEFDTTTWVANANCTVATSGSQAYVGSKSLAMTSSASGDMSARNGSTYPATIPMRPGDTVSAIAFFRSAVSARSVRLQLIFRDINGNSLSTSSGSIVADTTTGWTMASITATAPSLTAGANLLAVVLATGAASEVHYIDGMNVRLSSSPSWIADASSWSRGGVAGSSTFVLECSDDGGVTWSTHRATTSSGASYDSSATQYLVVYDYESPPGRSRFYRAKSYALVSSATLSSSVSNVANSRVDLHMDWWLKSPLDPSVNARVDVMSTFGTRQREQAAKFNLLGRTKPVVVTDVISGEDSNGLSIGTFTEDYEALVLSLGAFAYFPLTDDSGSTATDLMGYDGTYTNSPLLAGSPVGGLLTGRQGVLFDGVNDRVVLPTVPANLLNGALSLVTWVYMQQDNRLKVTSGAIENTITRLVTAGLPNRLIYFLVGNAVGASNELVVALVDDTGVASSMNVGVYLANSIGATYSGVSFNTWTMIGVTFAGFGSASRTVYINGGPVGTDTSGSAKDYSSAFRLSQDERQTGYDTGLLGTQAETAFFPYALSADDMVSLYQRGSSMFAADYEAVSRLITKQETLLLQSGPLRKQWYVRIFEDRAIDLEVWPVRRVNVPYAEVDAP